MSDTIKHYWVNAIVSGDGEGKPWELHMYDACVSMNKAIKEVWRLHKTFGLLAAWITDEKNAPIWVHSFINTCSTMEPRDKEPEWLTNCGGGVSDDRE